MAFDEDDDEEADDDFEEIIQKVSEMRSLRRAKMFLEYGRSPGSRCNSGCKPLPARLSMCGMRSCVLRVDGVSCVRACTRYGRQIYALQKDYEGRARELQGWCTRNIDRFGVLFPAADVCNPFPLLHFPVLLRVSHSRSLVPWRF